MLSDTLQLNESIPYVSIAHFEKAIGEGRRLVAAENRQKFVGLGGRDAETMCQRSAVERRRQIRGLEERNVEEHRFSEEDHRRAQQCRLRDVVARVRTLRSLF